MPQKVLSGRCSAPTLDDDLLDVKVDQVVLTTPTALRHAVVEGLEATRVETAVAYDGVCVAGPQHTPAELNPLLVQRGVMLARPGIGFPAAVHLERFAGPGRLALVDDPRLCALGAIGMLTLVAPTPQLSQALCTGRTQLRSLRSVQILITGKLRPFLCAKDAALELVRLGLEDLVHSVDQRYGSPVVLEFSGPGARTLSVPQRAVLAALAPRVGAAGSVFVSDEKTEVFLRDQRRSKAFRGLAPDPGAPCDDVLGVDLAVLDPLLQDERGRVRAVRELEGERVSQVILGGDVGAPLADLLAAAALTKSKRLSNELDFLVAPPSRQCLEVLAQTGKVADLIATGARFVEPDYRVLGQRDGSGALYPPRSTGVSLRTFDPVGEAGERTAVVSAQTLAFAVATGSVGDPRGFKRPPRVTLPRVLPTEDVLLVRKARGRAKSELPRPVPGPDTKPRWNEDQRLSVGDRLGALRGDCALVASSKPVLRELMSRISEPPRGLRVVLAPHIPSSLSTVLCGAGILALEGTNEQISRLEAIDELTLPALDPTHPEIRVMTPNGNELLRWAARGHERRWMAPESSTSQAAGA